MNRSTPYFILPLIVFAQFAGTSVWFAGNAIVDPLLSEWQIDLDQRGWVISAVQAGFIIGTLVSALLTLSDRIRPSRLFLLSSLCAAVANILPLLISPSLTGLLLSRFLTGVALAGIYPVGMKLAASWFAADLGRAIGFLVGALVVGTAFPYLLTASTFALPWEAVLAGTSLLALSGGLIIQLKVSDGPHLAAGTPFQWSALPRIYQHRPFRAAAFGYFGHMWELYAFWAFLPLFLQLHWQDSDHTTVAGWSFLIIAAGALGCIIGGLLSKRFGSASVASLQLFGSALCCLFSPWIIELPTPLFLFIMLLWGVWVVGDSPQFSALGANTAPKALLGTALTSMNCIGFSISILSIQLLDLLSVTIDQDYLYLFLLPGPVLGLLAMRPLLLGKLA